MMTVVNYSVQDTFGNNQFFWNGVGWYQELLNPASELGGRFYDSLGRNLLFSALILAIEVPLGVLVALSHAAAGLDGGGLPRDHGAAAAGAMERRRHDLADFRARGHRPARLFRQPRPAHRLQLHRRRLLGLDHHRRRWTSGTGRSLVALLSYAGLKSIPDAYYQAARIDGASRWAVFTTIQLPKLRRVLLIGVLLRFMDSFMIYTEPFVVTGGGPGNSTTILSIDLVKIALGQFDLGKAAAMSIVYYLIVLAVCWVFYTVMTQVDADRAPEEAH